MVVMGRKSELLDGLARRNNCGGEFCAESELECSRRVSLSCPVPQRLAEGARLAGPLAAMPQRLTALLMGVNGRVSMRHACGSAASPLCARVETIILGIDRRLHLQPCGRVQRARRQAVASGLAGGRRAASNAPAMPAAKGRRRLRPGGRVGWRRLRDVVGCHRVQMAKPSIWTVFSTKIAGQNHF